MPLSVRDLVDKSRDQRSRSRFDEALTSALSAVATDSKSLEAWWQVALSHVAKGDHLKAIIALNTALEIDREADGVWAQLGRSLQAVGQPKESEDAFIESLRYNRNNVSALIEMAAIYANADDKHNYEAELSVLVRLEQSSLLKPHQCARLGYLNFQINHFHEAIKYWSLAYDLSKDPSNLFNIGLAYNRVSISQDADAIDVWRLTRHEFPDYDRPDRILKDVLPRMLTLATAARAEGETLLPMEQWYDYYLNPFELLNAHCDTRLEDFSPRALQKSKQSLLQEIVLEEGNISWLPELSLDKSRAIGLCDELNDDVQRLYHWRVFSHKPLLNFLSKGAHEHFLVDHETSPIELLGVLAQPDDGFRKWLGKYFAPQFDRVLCRAIDSKNLIVLECLLDGRRWLPRAEEDRCFANARRKVERLIQPLIDLHEESECSKPILTKVSSALESSALLLILNLLPSFFEDLQNSAVKEIRGIAINCVNVFDDNDLARQVIELCRRFHFKSADVNHQIESDVRQIEEMIAVERSHEVNKTSGADKWKIADVWCAAAHRVRVTHRRHLAAERRAGLHDLVPAGVNVCPVRSLQDLKDYQPGQQ